MLNSHRAVHGTKGEEVKPRKKRVKSEEGEDGEEPKKKAKADTGPKKLETFTVEGNKAAGEALHELSSLYFQAGEANKGGVFSKAAKAVREAEVHLVDAKAIVKLKIKGVGKATAGT